VLVLFTTIESQFCKTAKGDHTMNLMMKYQKNIFKTFLISFICFFSFAVSASDKQEVDNILALEKAPVGVLFELIGSENGKYLPEGLKKVEAYKIQLESKFPGIKVAVVTHGAEQFELTKDNAKEQSKTHDIVKRITAESVPVHVCSNHASWRGKTESDFPDYVLASSGAGSQMKEYQDQGYSRVTIY